VAGAAAYGCDEAVERPIVSMRPVATELFRIKIAT
jgi:hypothetical protein